MTLDPWWSPEPAEDLTPDERAELAGPEPGTREWDIATGRAIDPEPDWDLGEPYLDQAHGVAYWDTAAAMEAGRDRLPSYRHVGPEPEVLGPVVTQPWYDRYLDRGPGGLSAPIWHPGPEPEAQ